MTRDKDVIRHTGRGWTHRTIRALLAFTVTCSLAGTLVASSASAAYLPVSEHSPDYVEVPPPSNGVKFEITSVPNLAFAVISVSTRNVLSAKGALLGDYVVGGCDLFFGRTENDTPGKYRCYEGGGWTSTPGTYYWQVSATIVTDTFEVIDVVSEVFVIVVKGLDRVTPTPIPTPRPAPLPAPTAPPPPPAPPAPPVFAAATITTSDSAWLVKTLIKKRTGHRPRHLVDRCVQHGPSSVTCRASWISAGGSARTLLYSGTFHFSSVGKAIASSFIGVSANYRCERHPGTRRCETRVHWH